jgi:glycosyltransferase involved in cell wall biosynthesis
MLIKRGCRRIVLYLWRPEFRAALEVIPWDLSCYHIDDEYSFSEVESFSDPTELALIAKVDQVIIHSPRLLERKGAINPNTIFVPNGVDFFAYAKTAAEPHDMRSIPRPRIGYTGALKRQLDWTLLLELSKRRLDWFFVFVGPQSPHQETRFAIEELSHRPNVYFLGGKSTQDLAAYPQHFDTCIMPYRIDGYTNNIYPLKLHEYLASGRPIVGSPIRSLQDFRHVIKLAATSDEWVRAIAESLAPEARSDAEVEARRSVAREHDWNKLVSRIANAFCGRLGAEFSARFHDLPQHN